MQAAIRSIRKSDAHNRLALYYQEFIPKHETDFQALDYELPQIEHVLTWLARCIHGGHSQILPNLIEHFTSYLEFRSLHNITLKYIDICLIVAQDLGQNLGKLYMIGYRAYWATGQWDKALEYVGLATESLQSNPHDYAAALQALGSAQLNRGDYSKAHRTFAKARKIYHDEGDANGEISVEAEEAAYYLNKADFQTAYDQYSAVMEFELHHARKISDHTLLMMGVVSRRLKKYAEALEYLYKLAKRAEVNLSRSALAVAAHHIAWVLIDQGQYSQAKEYAELAKAIFDDINDPRGSSDADEQLGLIATAMGKYDQAGLLLKHSLATRKEIGNQQGYASSLHRMATLNFMKAQFVSGFAYLLQSLYAYYKIGMLPFRRTCKFLFDAFRQKIVS